MYRFHSTSHLILPVGIKFELDGILFWYEILLILSFFLCAFLFSCSWAKLHFRYQIACLIIQKNCKTKSSSRMIMTTLKKLETGNCTAVILFYNKKKKNIMKWDPYYHVCCAYLNYKLIMRVLRIYVDIHKA